MQGNYDDFWRLETDTTIAEEKDGAYTFEDTVFWGEKGGMPSDRGTINELPITDLTWKDGVLWHRVNGSLSLIPFICRWILIRVLLIQQHKVPCISWMVM